MVSELNLFKYINYDSCEITLLMELVHNMEFLIGIIFRDSKENFMQIFLKIFN